LPATKAVKQAIIAGVPAAQLFDLAVRTGMRTLKQDGIEKVLSGTTDLAQVLAVSQR
jgi:type II secretory ATPase GspE/PulE/Tfp pilus assembly ATPase PilB-like protein